MKVLVFLNEIKKDILRNIFSKKFIKNRIMYGAFTVSPIFMYAYFYTLPKIISVRNFINI